mmetsp:Transcript_22545/g.54766  ORF Transcript_22545/g.54766 Transcript_22545/m.54766 type:complete len:314 (+) Transcript_22545:656-1597(+)
MSFSRAAISSLRSVIWTSRSWILVSSCFFWNLASVVSSSFLLMFSSQWSFFSNSSACSVLRLAIISSIAFLTFSRPWIFRDTDRPSRAREPDFCAAAFSIAEALDTRTRSWTFREVVCSTCTNWPEELNSSRASSLVRMPMVSATACSSSLRSFTLASYSLSAFVHVSSKSARNFSSASSVAWVSSRSLSAFSRSTLVSASAVVLSLILLVWVAISFSRVVLSSAKASACAFSVAVASSSSCSMPSCICFNMPRILPDLALYDLYPGPCCWSRATLLGMNRCLSPPNIAPNMELSDWTAATSSSRFKLSTTLA